MTRPRLTALACAVIVLLLALLARAAWLQDSTAAAACGTGAGGLDCLLRRGVGILMHFRVFGWTSLALAGMALLHRRAWSAGVALGSSAVGLVFYNADLAAVGAVLALIALARCPLTTERA